MDSYTYMSDEGITATIDAMQGRPEHKYPIELNYTDFSNLMWALQHVHNTCGDDDPYDSPDPLADWAGQFASSIADTLGVEMV